MYLDPLMLISEYLKECGIRCRMHWARVEGDKRYLEAGEYGVAVYNTTVIIWGRRPKAKTGVISAYDLHDPESLVKIAEKVS